MTAVVVRGDAAHLPLPDASVDLVVTSPPYFGLRSYSDNVQCYECIQMEAGGRDPRQAWPDYAAHVEQVHRQHYAGQIGSEATPGEYLEALWGCTREWVRVLRPGGSVFVNLGDKYSQRVATRVSSHQDGLFPGRPELRKDWKRDRAAGLARMPYENVIDDNGFYIPEKSLMGLPWRYAIGCVDRLGLILRAEIVWSKPNGLPESVTDRVRRSHEQVFHFTVRPRYYAAVDEIREPHQPGTFARAAYPAARAFAARNGDGSPIDGGKVPWTGPNPLGKLPGSVWSIPSAPLVVPPWVGVDHFAAFPPELVRRIVLGWSPPGVCTVCGEGRRPVSMRDLTANRKGRQSQRESCTTISGGTAHQTLGWERVVTITGYACGCPVPDAPARPSIVVDPFGGTGTTALVASVLGRVGVTVDRSGDYCRLAAWRTRDPGERARALGMPKPPPVPDGQGSLFDDEAVSW